ncbi:LuxR C-terminal-related transcriptional regulator [Actinoplanes sp. CA-142083]|uniref:LuxR C-terminal-related transcriptional regulator n=1 Tax=Actinoplanes sp. CA-142083 TaxID=3239903 RepID=UPI003D920589
MGVVGRSSELRRIGATLRDGGALLVVGDAGAGKSALLDAVAGGGGRVLRATGVEFESRIPYAGLHQLLLPAVRDTAAGPALRVALGLDDGPAPDPLSVSNAVLALLAERSPVTLLVDDLDLLDRPSATVLGLVARRLTGLPVALIGAQRAGAGGFFERSGLPRLVLEPLGEDASRELLDQRHPGLDPRARRRLLDEARGNPLALIELPMGRRLGAADADRIGALPGPARELLLLAALTGEPADVRAVAGTAAGLSDLDPAVRAGVIDVDPETGRLSFRRPLSRFAVIEGATLGERAEAHRRLADRAADPVRRAFHLAEATIEPDEKVAELVEQASRTVLERGDAVAGLETLTRSAELSTDRRARVRRLARAATLGAELAGTLDHAQRLLDEANRSAEDASGSLELATAAASVLFNRDCAVDAAHRLLTRALDAHVGDLDQEAVAEALQLLLELCWFGGRPELWPPFHEWVRRLGADAPDTLRIGAAALADPVRLAAPVVVDLEVEMRTLSRTENPRRIIRLGLFGTYVDRIGPAREALHRVVEDGRHGGAVAAALNAIVTLSVDGWVRGRWDETLLLIGEGQRLSRERGYTRYDAALGCYLGSLIGAARGNQDAEAAAVRLERWASARGARIALAFAAHVHCVAALGRGEFEVAYRHATAVAPPGMLPSHQPQVLSLLLDLVESAVRTGREHQARRHVAAMRAASLDRLSSRLALVVGAAEALIAPEDERATLLEQALAAPGASQWAFAQARVRLLLGEALRRRRQITEARRQLAAAVEAFDRLGAGPWSGRAAAELRAAGPTRSVGALLTAQEREIAELAATGLTNKEIGERLALSPRTVAAHLYRTFPKLGISSRAALRDALTR